VFGRKHFSLLCFRRSVLASYCVALCAFAVYLIANPKGLQFFAVGGTNGELDLVASAGFKAVIFLMALLVVNAVPDYLSLLETRYILALIIHANSTAIILLLLIIDLVITGVTAISLPLTIVYGAAGVVCLEPVGLFSTITGWLPTYVDLFLSRFLHSRVALALCRFRIRAKNRTALRYRLCFDCFNRHFDIEKRPLQSIGLVLLCYKVLSGIEIAPRAVS
jgi:hypothetical protein